MTARAGICTMPAIQAVVDRRGPLRVEFHRSHLHVVPEGKRRRPAGGELSLDSSSSG